MTQILPCNLWMVLGSDSFHVEPHLHFSSDWRKTRVVVARLKPELAFNISGSAGVIRWYSDIETEHRTAFVNRDHSLGKLQLPHQRTWVRNWSNLHAGRSFDVELCGDEKFVERFA